MAKPDRRARGALLAAVFAFAPARARAESYAFHAYAPDSLPSPTIRALFQDRGGRLWLGSELGLVRYDGTSFEPYASSDIGPVSAIVEDGAGRIWSEGFAGLGVVTGDGLLAQVKDLGGARVRAIVGAPDGVWAALGAPSSLARVRLDPGARTPRVERIELGDPGSLEYRDLLGTRDGDVIVGTRGDGLRIVANDGHVTKALPGRQVFSLAASRDGRRTLVGTDAGLWTYEKGAARAAAGEAWLGSATITAAFEASDGAVYAGTSEGDVARCAPRSECRAILRDGPRSGVESFAEDGVGIVWAAPHAPAVIRYVPGAERATVVDQKKGFPFSDVLHVYADRTGLVFVATVAGLVRIVGSGVANFDDADGILGSTVWCIARLPPPSRALILGTQNGLALVDDGHVRPVVDGDGRPLKAVLRVLPQGDTLLAGTETGLRRIRLDEASARVTHVDTIEGVAGRIESFVHAPNGDVMVAGRAGGLARVRGGRAEPVPLPGIEGDDSVDHVVLDRAGRLWIATSRGVMVQHADGSVARIERRHGILDEDVDLVFEASDGAIWIAYTKNLGATAITVPAGPSDKVDPGAVRVRHLTTANGLPADSAYAFAEIGAGRPGHGLWIGTSRGLARLDGDAVTRFGRGSGMASEDVSYGGILAVDDTLWVGTTRGVSRLDTARLRRPMPPVVDMASVTLGGEPATRGARVPFARRDFAARFTSLVFQGEAETTFRYRLLGYRDAWTPFTRDRAAVFANLPPGDYRLDVEARAADGTTGAQPASFPFTVITPVYMTTWFRALLVAAGAIAIAGIWRVRVARLRSANRALEARVAERTHELELRVADLRRANTDLVASQKRADRIFSALADALPGTIIEEKYRLEERIGVGGSGVVFRAEHLALGRPIAVKIFKPMPGNDSAEALERFRLEGMSAARIEHPNAVRVFDSGISGDGLAYLVMELLEGRPLSAELADTPVASFERVVAVIDAVGSVLETAHGIGVVHRDIKPENVFLHHGADGDVIKVVDFGIAKQMDAPRGGPSGLTLEGAMLGTPAYMAPERFESDPSLVGPPSDVYALGVLAFQMVTGRLPFGGTFMDMVTGHVSVPPPAASSLRLGVPPAADAALHRALAKAPDERPSARELAAELRGAFGMAHVDASTPNLTSGTRARGAA